MSSPEIHSDQSSNQKNKALPGLSSLVMSPEWLKEFRTEPDLSAAPALAGACIKVVGVGGCGGNALDHLINAKVTGASFIAVNCDGQDLQLTQAPKKIQIGRHLTQGLGAGMNPEIGRRAAEEARDDLYEVIKGADMVLITCGLGGGTGTGAAPVIAEIARNQSILTLAVVTQPFSFERAQRVRVAEIGLSRLKEAVDAVIVIPNDRLLEIAEKGISLTQAFSASNDVLRDAVKSIVELIVKPGIVNIDFADIKTILVGAGFAFIGMAMASGDDRAVEAAEKAVGHPLLAGSLENAQGILFAVAGGDDLALFEIREAARVITESIYPETKVIFGAFQDETLQSGSIKITVIAAGLPDPSSKIIAKKNIKHDLDPDDIDIPAFIRRRLARYEEKGK